KAQGYWLHRCTRCTAMHCNAGGAGWLQWCNDWERLPAWPLLSPVLAGPAATALSPFFLSSWPLTGASVHSVVTPGRCATKRDGGTRERAREASTSIACVSRQRVLGA